MRVKTVLCVLILFWTAIARAEVIPGRWELVEALRTGTVVIVKLHGGDRIEGAFSGIGPNEIIIAEKKDKERRLPRTAVSKIEMAAATRDSPKNGTLIGTAVGAASGLLAIVGYAKTVTNVQSIGATRMGRPYY